MGKKCTITIRFEIFIFVGVLSFLAMSPLSADETWTLERAVERAATVSNTIKAVKENVKAHRANLEQVKKWPNPEFEIEGSNKLGKQDGKEDFSLTSFALSQPLPIMRLSSEQARAHEILLQEESYLRYQALKLEYDLAQDYHNLQFIKAIFDIAKKKVSLVEERLESHNEEGGIVRFLPPLEKARLNIIKQNAAYDLEKAEGEYLETVSQIKIKLQMSEAETFDLSELSPDLEVQDLEKLKERQEQHPLIIAFQHSVQASKASVKLAKMQRFEEPEIKVFTEKDFFNDERESFYGTALSIKLPFWDRKSGQIKKEMAETERLGYELKAQQLDLEGNLTRSYQHFHHLKRLEKEYRKGLDEAERFLDLTIKGFSAGESNILSLIDAYETYYDSQLRYLEILKDLWLEYSEIRFAANIVFNNAYLENLK